MDRLIGIVYPFDQTTKLEQQLATRVQVEKLIRPLGIETTRYDKILMFGSKEFFPKLILDKLSVLYDRNPELFQWVDDSPGVAAQILSNLPRKSTLGAFQAEGNSELQIELGKNFTILFNNKSPILGEWRMKVKAGGSGVASLTFFDADFGGKLLRTYDIYVSEFTDGWFNFRLPNPIFKADKRLAVSFQMKQLVGSPPIWISHQGWSEHSMLVGGKKSDFVSCFETL
jgi:hypothetical protein